MFPDPEMKLKGFPYVQYYRGTPECEPIQTEADGEGNPIYIFEFNIDELKCGIVSQNILNSQFNQSS